jgi:hypothetical protein
MALRVHDLEVKQIIATVLDTTPFIQLASHLVDDLLMPQGLSDTRLRDVELWLAAHYTCLRDPRVVDVRDGDTGVRYEQVKTGEGLASTRYGQQALLLDPTGTLAALDDNAGRNRVRIKFY